MAGRPEGGNPASQLNDWRARAAALEALGVEVLICDPRRLDVPGRKRLEIDYGRPIREILS